MDVTDKQSILQARDVIAEKEGRIHILVNKCILESRGSLRALTYHTVQDKLDPCPNS